MQGRRGTLYHVELPRGLTRQATLQDMTLRKKFGSGKFFFSVAGALHLVTVVIMLVGAILFLATEVCKDTPLWYSWLYPMITLLIGVVTAAVFVLFVLGIAEDNPNPWVKVTVGVSIAEVVAGTTISILTITACDSSLPLHNIPGPLGLVGSLLLAISSAALFIMWRYREDEEEDETLDTGPPTSETTKPRKSIFI